jgi:predicted lipoprotein with Yx(FWY)xxD motif
MRKPWTLIGISVLMVALAVAVIACSSSKKNTSATQTAQYQNPKATQTAVKTAQPAAATPPATTASTPAEGATVISTMRGQLGLVITDAAGRTLYVYANDKPGVSNCTGACAQAWPPFTAGSGTPTSGAGVATIQRSDGTTQVTYGGSPLYYYVADTAAGDAKGDGVGGFSVIKLGG